jgi:peroxiredoxin
MKYCSSCLHLIAFILATVAVVGASAAKLEGIVLDSEGKSVAGAQVWVVQKGDVRKTESGSDGKFGLDRIDVAVTEVVGLKEGLAIGGASALVVGDATVEIRLQPADLITLKVLDSQSKPVAGAQISSMLIQRSIPVSVEKLLPHGFPAFRSTDDGILVIPQLPAGGFIQAVLGHPDFADSAVSYLPVESEQRNIVLQRGRRVSGRVTFSGAGVSGAHVSVFRTGTQGQKVFANTVTDTEGFYTVRLEPNVYGIAARHADYAPPPPAPLEVAPDTDTPPLNFEMKPAKYIRGKVLLPNKKPSGGTRITYREGPTLYDDTFTNNKGEFSLKVPGGPGALSVLAPPGYIYPSPVDIQIALGDVKDVDLKPIELEPLPVITGIIKDAEGNASGPALVTALNLPVPYSVVSDEKGRFSMPLNFMPAVETIQLRAEHKLRFQRAPFEVDLKKVKPTELKLEQYTPELAPRPAIPGANNLDGLVGKPAPALKGDAWVNSEPVTLESLKGKVVVMLFWAGFDEDMGPVVIRELLTLRQLLADQDDVAFIGIHDAISAKDEIAEYIKNYTIPFPVLRDTDEQTTFGEYGIVFIPEIVLLDKKGNLRYYQTQGRLLELIKGLRREE